MYTSIERVFLVNNLSKKMETVLSGMNKNDIRKLVDTAKKSGLTNRLSETDKQKLINEFSKMDTNEIRRKLSKLNVSDLQNLQSDRIIEKIKKL